MMADCDTGSLSPPSTGYTEGGGRGSRLWVVLKVISQPNKKIIDKVFVFVGMSGSFMVLLVVVRHFLSVMTFKKHSSEPD